MEMMTNTTAAMPATLDSYARQGRMFLNSAAQNLIQFGRVLTEAKPLIQHGTFEKWVNDSFGISKSTAESYMAVWKRFGSQEQFEGIAFSKLREMLSLPVGTEEQFVQDNDLNEKSVREIKRAVQQAKAEAQAEIDRERAARKAAENRIRALEKENTEVPAEIMDEIAQQNAAINGYKAEIQRMSETAKIAMSEKNELSRKLSNAQRDLAETEDMLAESQQRYDQMQRELLNAQSAIAKGDAERVIDEEMSGEDFAIAVRQFMGAVVQVPHMRAAFSLMDAREIRVFREYIETVKDWCERSMDALNTIEGVIIDG